MKKTVLFSLLLGYTVTCTAQERIFENHFYQTHLNRKVQFWDIAANTYNTYTTSGERLRPGNAFLWGYDYVIEAYVNAIKSETNLARKKEYTDFAIDLMAHILDKRDDNDLNRDAAMGGGFIPSNFSRMDEKQPPPLSAANNIKKWWVARDVYNNFRFEGSAGISGRLTWPMAELANYILSNQGFYAGKFYRSNNTSAALSNRYMGLPYQTAGSNWNSNGYRKIALDLIARVDETFEEHFSSGQWDDINTAQGAFKHESWVAGPNARNGAWGDITLLCPYYLELNFQAAAGLAMLSLYNACKTTQHPKTAFYKEKVRRLGNYMRANIKARPSDSDWFWYYQNPDVTLCFTNNNFTYSNYPEDVEHAFIFADFAYYMAFFGANISHNNGTTPVFDKGNDMIRIKDIVNNIYANKPLWFYRYINGNDAINNVYTDPAYAIPANDYDKNRADVAFIKYAKWDWDIYHRLSEVLYDNLLKDNLGGYEFKLLSDMVLYSKDPVNQSTMKNLFRPYNVSRSPGNGSDWIAAEGGDLDGDGKAFEYVAVRDYDDTFYAYRANSDGSISNIAAQQISPGSAQTDKWVDLATGNFGHSAPGQEFAAVKNYNGSEHIYLYRVDGNTIGQLASYTGFGNSSDWKGICSADLDADGVDEIVAVRNYDGTIASFSYNGSANLAGFGTLITNITNWKTLEGGDIDGNGKDEIVAVTTSGTIHVFYYENGTIKSAIIAGGNINIPVRAATLGDFDRNRRQDNLIIGDINGYFYKYKIAYTGMANGKKKFQVSYQAEEKFDNTWFSKAMVIGKIGLAPLNCDEDKLILIRNSAADGHMFIFDAGYVKDNSWQCAKGSSGKQHKR